MKRLLLIPLLFLPIMGSAQKGATKLKKELEKINAKRAAATEKLNDLKSDVRDVRAELQAADDRLENVQNQIETSQERLDFAQKRQAELIAELQKAEGELAANQAQVRLRLRAMYLKGQGNAISALLGMASSGDLASRQFVLDRIAKQDRALFAQYVAVRDAVKQKKTEQDALVAEVKQILSTQKTREDELESARNKKAEILKSLEVKQETLKDIVDAFDDDAAKIQNQLAELVRKQMEAAAKKGGNLPRLGDGRFGPPAMGGATSSFGMRFHPILKYNRMHNGIDFGGGYGAPVYATADGVVISTSKLGGYGNAIIIDHGGGLASVCGHLSRIMVKSGASVRRGQRIGSIGSSGLSTGPHLHFEIRKNGTPVNPTRYLR